MAAAKLPDPLRTDARARSIEDFKTGLVIIGRNEGARLVRCIASARTFSRCVYVDSGSTDGSAEAARRAGVKVVELSSPPHFTAARARNAGIARLLTDDPDLEFVQMVDGDCELQPGWFAAAVEALAAEHDLALVFGRRRERFPERSIYNALCDDEWDAPIGYSAACGGDALFRVSALREVGFYIQTMIAGEDSELSMRLRKHGWRLRRIDAEMTLHDADMHRFGQWWNRVRRSGHAFAEMAFLHPDAREPNWPGQVRSIVFWGGLMTGGFAACVLLALTMNRWFWLAACLALLAWPARMAQLARRQRERGLPSRVARASGVLLILGKIPQFFGLIGYHCNRLSGRASKLIEYKGPEAA